MKHLGSRIYTTYPSNLFVRSLSFRSRLFTSSEILAENKTERGGMGVQIAEWLRVSKEAKILAETKKLISI